MKLDSHDFRAFIVAAVAACGFFAGLTGGAAVALACKLKARAASIERRIENGARVTITVDRR